MSGAMREEEAATSDVDDYQNFMQFYSTVAPHGRLTPMNLPTQPKWTSLSAGGFDGMAYNFIAARGKPKHTSLVGLAVMEGMIVPLADRVPSQAVLVGTQPAEFFYGPMMGAWTTAALFAGEAGLTSLDGAWGTHLTLNSNGQARSDFTLLDKLDRTRAAADQQSAAFKKICFRRGLDPAIGALRRVEIQRARGPGAQMMPALSLFQQLQILCRIDYSSVCDVTFGTYIDDTAADLLAREKATFWGRFVKPTWRALWGFDVLPVPDIFDPKKMQPGDSVVEKRWTRKTFLSAFGKLLVFFGFHRAQFVQASLAVKRLLESVDQAAPKVQIQIGFSSVQSGRFWAALVGNLSGHRGEHRMQREIYEVEVALRTPPLLQAYQELVGAARNGSDAKVQAAALRRLSRLAIEDGQEDARHKRTGSRGCTQTEEAGTSFVGLGLGLLASWFPSNFSLGMSRRRVYSRHNIDTTSEGHLRLAGKVESEKRGPDGERSTRISAKTWEPPDGETHLPGITLEAHISLGRADASEVNQLIVDPLGTHFNVPMNSASGAANFLGAGWRTSRDVIYRQNCSYEALHQFAKKHLGYRAIENKNAVDPLTSLARELASLFEGGFSTEKSQRAKCAEQLIDAFDRYFRKSTLASFGKLMTRLHTFEPDVLALLESECDAYEIASREQRAIAQKLDHATSDEAKNLLKYANEVIRPIIYHGKQLAQQDPFLSDVSRSDLIERLEEQEQSIASTFQNYRDLTNQKSPAMRNASLYLERTLKPYDGAINEIAAGR